MGPPSGSQLRRSPSDPKHVLSGATSTGTLEASTLNYTSAPSDSDRQDMSPASLGVSRRHDSTSKSLSTWQDEQKLVMHDQTLLELQAKMDTLERAYKQKVSVHACTEVHTYTCAHLMVEFARTHTHARTHTRTHT